MARAHWVKSSRTPHHCKAGHEITPPSGYYWAAPGYHAPKRFACKEHPFRLSELTAGLQSSVYAAQEAVSDEFAARDNITTGEDIEAAVEGFLGELQDYLQQRQEALDAWEHGNSQLEEYVSAAEEAVDEVENWTLEPYEGEMDDDGRPVDDDEYHDWLGDQMDAALEVIEGINI